MDGPLGAERGGMYDFIVLGIIPGTETELTFTFWLILAGTLVGAFALGRLVRLIRRIRYARTSLPAAIPRQVQA